MYLYLMTVLLMVLGLYCLIAKRHLIKKIIGLMIIEYSTNLFLILVGYKHNGIPPILFEGMDVQEFVRQSVDPIPQALVLTSIVIGLSELALLVTISLYIYEKFKTFDTSEISRLKG